MKAATALLTLTLAASACTTLKPTELPADELHRLIRTESLIDVRDRVRLVTADGTAHEFRVTRVDLDRDTVEGKHEAVPISDIVTVQTRKVAAGKTAGLAAGLYVGIPEPRPGRHRVVRGADRPLKTHSTTVADSIIVGLTGSESRYAAPLLQS